jgi:hypothetical protein
MSIKRFDKYNGQSLGKKPEWPESESKKEGIYEGRKAYRKLVVMIDYEIINDVDENDMVIPDKLFLLKSLLLNDLIDTYKYGFNITPKDSERLEHKWSNQQDAVYPGYVILYPKKKDDFWPATFSKGDNSASYSAVMGNFSDVAKNDSSDETYTGPDAPKKREADMLALQTAKQSVDSDIFITNRPYLFNGSNLTLGRGVTVLRPEDAIPVLGLYLRAQQEFITPTGQKKFTMTMNRGLFYWVGTRELLPEAWRWFSACVYHSSGTNDDKLSYLGGATLSRIQRALELRDQVHIAINRITNNDTNDLAMTNLDGALTSLMGAVDASARVAHYVLGLNPEMTYFSGWQRERWLRLVREVNPDLGSIVSEGTDNYHILRILSLLRNSIHGEPIHAITKQESLKTDIILALPREEETNILSSMDATGGREMWGVKQLTPNLNEVDPGILIDKLFEEVIKFLNAVMKATPIELLSHLENIDLTAGPKNTNDHDTFSEWNRVNTRWQLGF